MDDIDTARHVSLTTFTKDGRPKFADGVRAKLGRGDEPVAIRITLAEE